MGSCYIWWSAIQGIRQRDFTADIPVSFATAGALAIGQYSAAAAVARSIEISPAGRPRTRFIGPGGY